MISSISFSPDSQMIDTSDRSGSKIILLRVKQQQPHLAHAILLTHAYATRQSRLHTSYTACHLQKG